MGGKYCSRANFALAFFVARVQYLGMESQSKTQLSMILADKGLNYTETAKLLEPFLGTSTYPSTVMRHAEGGSISGAFVIAYSKALRVSSDVVLGIRPYACRESRTRSKESGVSMATLSHPTVHLVPTPSTAHQPQLEESI
jgi:hypothetical protein